MISKNCIKISEMLLVIIDGKRVYDNLEFEDDQVGHRIYLSHADLMKSIVLL